MENWKEEGKKIEMGLAGIIKDSVDRYNTMAKEDIEAYYQYLCKFFKKFLRYQHLMGDERFYDNYMSAGLNFGIILIKKFGGEIMTDESGHLTTKIKVQTKTGEVAVNPWEITRDSFDREDQEGNRRNIEEICANLGIL